MPSRSRNAFTWATKTRRNPNLPAINEHSGLPLILGDTVLGRITKKEYHIILSNDGIFRTIRLHDGEIKSLGVAIEGKLVISAEQTKQRLAAYERWKTKQREEKP